MSALKSPSKQHRAVRRVGEEPVGDRAGAAGLGEPLVVVFGLIWDVGAGGLERLEVDAEQG